MMQLIVDQHGRSLWGSGWNLMFEIPSNASKSYDLDILKATMILFDANEDEVKKEWGPFLRAPDRRGSSIDAGKWLREGCDDVVWTDPGVGGGVTSGTEAGMGSGSDCGGGQSSGAGNMKN
ncbi:hypothetical protein ACS0TY_000161 [Phlomoides rotata]